MIAAIGYAVSRIGAAVFAFIWLYNFALYLASKTGLSLSEVDTALNVAIVFTILSLIFAGIVALSD